MNKIIYILICLTTASCTLSHENNAKNDPKHLLQEYVSSTFSVKSTDDRTQLMSYLTGEAKKRLGAWSDEQFSSAFIESKRQFLKLAFVELRELSQNEVNITYEIAFVNQGANHTGQTGANGSKELSSEAVVTDKKLCQLVRENGSWLIRDIRTIKELVEYKNEMSL